MSILNPFLSLRNYSRVMLFLHNCLSEDCAVQLPYLQSRNALVIPKNFDFSSSQGPSEFLVIAGFVPK